MKRLPDLMLLLALLLIGYLVWLNQEQIKLLGEDVDTLHSQVLELAKPPTPRAPRTRKPKTEATK